MKTVVILASLGVLSLLVLSCGVGLKTDSPAAPVPAGAPLPAPDPAIVLVDDDLQDNSGFEEVRRVLPQNERRDLIRKGKLPQGNPNDEVVEYTLYSRSGPVKHYKVPQAAGDPTLVRNLSATSPESKEKGRSPVVLQEERELPLPDYQIYSRAAPMKHLKVKKPAPLPDPARID